MSLTACSIYEKEVNRRVAVALQGLDSGLCEGLQNPVDELAGAILDNQKETPEEVILKGTTVIRGYDAGCSKE